MNTPVELTLNVNAKPSSSGRRRWAAGVAAVALCWPAIALADCVDTRKPTAGEMEFHSRAMAALVAALPAVPVGGKLQNKDSVTTLGQQCKGTTGDFNLQATRFYELNDRKAIVSVIMNARQLPVDATGLSAAYGAASPSRSAALKVNNLVWTVSGSDSPLRQALVDAMDRPRLQALVGQPLPSLAQSQALASQAVPASAAGPAVPATNASTAQTAPPSASVTPSAPAAPGQALTPEPLREAADAVNKLRGLFGR